MIPLRDTVPAGRAPVMTWTLIAINVAVFLYETSLEPHELERLFCSFGMVPARSSHPEWPRWFGLPLDNY